MNMSTYFRPYDIDRYIDFNRLIQDFPDAFRSSKGCYDFRIKISKTADSSTDNGSVTNKGNQLPNGHHFILYHPGPIPENKEDDPKQNNDDKACKNRPVLSQLKRSLHNISHLVFIAIVF